jgi:hypothetical protein
MFQQSWKATDAISRLVLIHNDKEITLWLLDVFSLMKSLTSDRFLNFRKSLKSQNLMSEKYAWCSRISYYHHARRSLIMGACSHTTQSLDSCKVKSMFVCCRVPEQCSMNLWWYCVLRVWSCGTVWQCVMSQISHDTVIVTLTLLGSWWSLFGWGDSGWCHSIAVLLQAHMTMVMTKMQGRNVCHSLWSHSMWGLANVWWCHSSKRL